MKIAITGHTRGLGMTLYRRLSVEHRVIGMSRTNGYDMSKDLSPFLIKDFDVYINNAYHEYSQADLLYRLFEQNKYRNCSIINIGSVSSDGNKDEVNRYAVHKTALEKACHQLQLIDSECRVIHMKLGRMNTPMTDHKKEYPRIDTNYIVDVVDWIIRQPHSIVIKDITVDIMHSRRKETK